MFHRSRIGEDIRDDFQINWKSIITPFYIEYHHVMCVQGHARVNYPREKI